MELEHVVVVQRVEHHDLVQDLLAADLVHGLDRAELDALLLAAAVDHRVLALADLLVEVVVVHGGRGRPPRLAAGLAMRAPAAGGR